MIIWELRNFITCWNNHWQLKPSFMSIFQCSLLKELVTPTSVKIFLGFSKRPRNKSSIGLTLTPTARVGSEQFVCHFLTLRQYISQVWSSQPWFAFFLFGKLEPNAMATEEDATSARCLLKMSGSLTYQTEQGLDSIDLTNGRSI